MSDLKPIPRTQEIRQSELLAESRRQIQSARVNILTSKQLLKRCRVLLTVRKTILAFKKNRGATEWGNHRNLKP